MTKRRKFLCAFLLSSALLLLSISVGIPARTALAEDREVAKIRIEVTEEGFKNNVDTSNIEIEQGQVVELTFFLGKELEKDETHLVELQGYDLKTRILNAQNPEDTLRFIAYKAGVFDFRCILFFSDHKNQYGSLHVMESGSPASFGTILSLESSMSMSNGEPVMLEAFLVDENRMPIPNTPVHFFVDVEASGTMGKMEVGSATTDATGVARLLYTPTFDGEQRISVRFEGLNLYRDSSASIVLMVENANPAYREAPTGLTPLRQWAPIGLIAVVLGVWSVFGYVLFQIYRISRSEK